MSCCPPEPSIEVVEIEPDEPTVGPEVERVPGEPEDCYVARRGNVSETGQVDDKTEVVPNRIKQNSINPNSDRSISLQFSLTTGTASSWEFYQADGTTPAAFTGITFTPGGLMSGTFDAAYLGQKLTLRVKALDSSSAVIDDRTYNFAVSDYSNGFIQLLHPLPGSVITSGFGPRKPPASGASSEHLALDFAYPGRRTEDVICAADGEVVLARPGSGYGNYVMVKHCDASGKHLITTLYAHLDDIYVKVGQKVSGGQKLGKEGSTGIGSGPHLHFEVRLPNNTRVDPTPYLRGDSPVVAANSVTSDNQPDPTAGTSNASYGPGTRGVTASEVEARQSCPEYGSSYPAVPIPPAPPLLPTDPFELAWKFVMLHEVNSLWESTPDRSPLDPTASPPAGNAVWQGLIDTQPNRQRTGFVNHPSDPGGSTKFGIAQRFNPGVAVEEVDYPTVRSVGYQKYWLAPGNNCSTMTSTKIAVMAFDMNYLLGPGGSKRVMLEAGVTGNEAGPAELSALDNLYKARLDYLQSRPTWPKFGRGWKKRADDCLAYCKSLP
jgi:murein DD-endopeptidase MepM/ murein hydrolase activator NlpD